MKKVEGKRVKVEIFAELIIGRECYGKIKEVCDG
jgi:hypothetical protein